MRGQKEKFTSKRYRLAGDRSGETFILKVGKNKRLVIFDETIGRNRPIRHCPNERSIFIDEQSQHALVEPIIFQFGVLDVAPTEQITQLFLDNHPDNVKNGGGWFEEINDDEDAEREVEIEDLILDIKQTIRDKEKERDGVYALEMAVAVLINSVEKASRMSPESLKRTLYNKVEENPHYFTDDNGNINIFDDEAMQRKYLTLRAIKDGIIKKSPNGKSMLWAKENTVITTTPRGVDLVEHFADFLSTNDGITVLEDIKRRS